MQARFGLPAALQPSSDDRWGRSLLRLGSLCALGCLLALPTGAEPVPVEYQQKAAFVLNFGSLAQWPEEAFAADDAPMVFCIVGTREIAEIFRGSFRDQKAANRTVELRHVRTRAALAGCHIAFVTATDTAAPRSWISAASNQPILTVGESEGFTNGGGMISFNAEGTKIRFEINLEAAENAGLRISSHLLRLARIVKSGSD